ncbi:MAG: type II secretion system protein [Sedimentisphaerales bacterium]
MRDRKTGFIPLETGRQGRLSDISNISSLTGFTLVELLVVMAIIAMLTGILLPALGATRRIAYRTLCKQNLHGCAIAFRMYLDDNKNIMPAIANMPNSVPSVDAPIYTVLKKYLSGPQALKCPADRWPEKNTSYFASEGSSYKYNKSLAGQTIDKTWMAKRFGTPEVWMISDYYGFHGRQNTDGSWPANAFMYLYADTLVADRERDK